jgi:integrase/recombinase XerD
MTPIRRRDMMTNLANATGHVSPLTIHVDSFLDSFRTAGYAPPAVTSRRLILNAFIRFIAGKRRATEDLRDADVAAFLNRRPTRPEDPKERAALRRFVAHLRAQGVCSPREAGPVTPAEEITQRYVAFLRQDRGLAENSIAVYAPCAREFFTYRVTQTGRLALKTLDADTIRTFLLGRTANRSTESSRLLSVSLRSVLRFLFLRGETPRDLSAAVPMVRTYRQSTVPAVLSTEEVERVLATPDRSTVRGRRDAAILLLLARLGLRASEIVFLELDNLHWRAGEIVIRGKGPQRDHVPLLANVGDALARYLRHGRGPSASRRVFLRVIPPRVGLARPCAIDHIVRLAFSRAGVRPRPRRVAHLFRHSLATRMIRRGASIPEIAQVLRHRSQSSTAIYAKVSVDALRGVARPWPVVGAGR